MSFPTRKIRTTRSANRNTLQPTVRDFSDQVIGYYPGDSQFTDDDGLYLDIASRTSNGQPMFDQRTSPRFAGSTVTYSTLEAAAQSHLPATFNTPRSSVVSPEEVHRRHVAKSARLRSRLSGNRQLQRTGDHWQDAPGYGGSKYGDTGLYPSPRPTSGHEVKRPWSGRPTQFIGHQSPRVRPATTGRYFNSSNGLRTSITLSHRPLSSSPASVGFNRTYLLNRPFTAIGRVGMQGGDWLGGPGLHINKMKLCHKGKG